MNNLILKFTFHRMKDIQNILVNSVEYFNFLILIKFSKKISYKNYIFYNNVLNNNDY